MPGVTNDSVRAVDLFKGNLSVADAGLQLSVTGLSVRDEFIVSHYEINFPRVVQLSVMTRSIARGRLFLSVIAPARSAPFIASA